MSICDVMEDLFKMPYIVSVNSCQGSSQPVPCIRMNRSVAMKGACAASASM